MQAVKLKEAAFHTDVLIIGIIGLLLLGIFIFRILILKRRNERLRLEHVLELQLAEFQQRTAELQMQALRAQMNPHFIFNSLNSINDFILQNNRKQASEYLTKFSRLVRLILQNAQAVFISLESELEALQLYLELEALRFDHHFSYTLNIEEDLDTSVLKVPPLIIQPYVENAIWHGLMHKKEKGHLEVAIRQQDNVLYCTICDDGIGRQKASQLKSGLAATHKSMGMQITADRIAMLGKSESANPHITIHDLTLADGRSAGTEVILKIPVQYA
jgi:LytS/YehU family sensor histidine kinase